MAREDIDDDAIIYRYIVRVHGEGQFGAIIPADDWAHSMTIVAQYMYCDWVIDIDVTINCTRKDLDNG